jgi:hypothetical protein
MIHGAYAATNADMLNLTRPLRLGICGTRRTGPWALNRVKGLTHPIEVDDRPKYKDTTVGAKAMDLE